MFPKYKTHEGTNFSTLLLKEQAQEYLAVGNKGYAFFEKDKDKDNILVDNILAILLEDIFRQLILHKDKGYFKDIQVLG